MLDSDDDKNEGGFVLDSDDEVLELETDDEEESKPENPEKKTGKGQKPLRLGYGHSHGRQIRK